MTYSRAQSFGFDAFLLASLVWARLVSGSVWFVSLPDAMLKDVFGLIV